VWRIPKIPAFKPVSNPLVDLKLIATHVLREPCAKASLPVVKSGVALAAQNIGLRGT
jgi:hypothetical protein